MVREKDISNAKLILRRDETIRRLMRSIMMLRMEELYAEIPEDARSSTNPSMQDRRDEIVSNNLILLNKRIVEPSKNGIGGTPDEIDWLIRHPDCAYWHWLDRYVKNGQSAWCGYAQSFAHREAGLQAKLVQKVLPSNYRLKKWAKDNDAFIDDPNDMIPSDTVLVDTYGDEGSDHITNCWAGPQDDYPADLKRISQDAKELYDTDEQGHRRYYRKYADVPHFVTHEGNAKGFFCDGTSGEGYVTRLRPLSTIRHIIRFREEHYNVEV